MEKRGLPLGLPLGNATGMSLAFHCASEWRLKRIRSQAHVCVIRFLVSITRGAAFLEKAAAQAQAAPEEAQAVPQATAEAGSPELIWEEEAPGQSQAEVFPGWLSEKGRTTPCAI